MTTRIVALGDSISCGQGVGLRVPAGCTWPALLAAALPDSELLSVAVAGARLRDVRRAQLSQAVTARADVCTLLIGLNDVARGGFDVPMFVADLDAVVDGLRATGAPVLLATLHDPTAVLPLPPRLKAAIRARTTAVNAALRTRAGEGVQLLDLAALPALRQRRVWDVDRLHPNAAGHATIATAAAEVLSASGWAVGAVPPSPAPRTPGAIREARWLMRHGLPWLGQHLPQVVVPALGLATRPAAGPP